MLADESEGLVVVDECFDKGVLCPFPLCMPSLRLSETILILSKMVVHVQSGFSNESA